MRVEIIDIGRSDLFYKSSRGELKGIMGNFKETVDWGKGWKGGDFSPDLRTSLGRERSNVTHFYKVKVREL